MQNHRVLGKFKSETGSEAPSDLVGLRAKMYSLNVPNQKEQSKIRAKGIKRSYVKKHMRHQKFLDVLKTQKSTQSHFRTLRGRNIECWINVTPNYTPLNQSGQYRCNRNWSIIASLCRHRDFSTGRLQNLITGRGRLSSDIHWRIQGRSLGAHVSAERELSILWGS